MSAWQNCLALNARGLKSDFSMTQDLTGLTGTLYYTGSSPISFLGVDNIGLGKASCNVTAYIGNKYVTKAVTADTTFKLSTKAANFNCQRTTGLDEQNRITAQTTRLTFKTSEGKLDIDLAPITLTQIDAITIDGLYQQINTLSQRTTAVETLTGILANQLVNSGKWTPIEETFLGNLPMNPITKVSYSIPNTVPMDAKEVLVYAYVWTGYVTSQPGEGNFKVYTEENSVEYAKYLKTYGASQNAASFNSDNIWLPITSTRTINSTYDGTVYSGYHSNAQGTDFKGGLSILGYR